MRIQQEKLREITLEIKHKNQKAHFKKLFNLISTYRKAIYKPKDKVPYDPDEYELTEFYKLEEEFNLIKKYFNERGGGCNNE